MCLRFVFLLITRLASWLRLSQREETWKTAEILILRHQLAVLQRRQPRRPNLDWADRALLATLLAVIPKGGATGCGCWSPRTRSCAGTATSSAAAGPPGPCAARPAGRPPAVTSGPWCSGWPGRTRLGLPPDPRRACGAWQQGSGVDGLADPQKRRDPSGAAPGRSGLAGVPALPGRGDPGAATSSPPTCSTAPRSMSWAVIEHATRRIRILGTTLHPTGTGSSSRPGTCSWTSGMQGRGRSSCSVIGTPTSPPRSMRCSPTAGIRVIRSARPGATDETSGCILHPFGVIGGFQVVCAGLRSARRGCPWCGAGGLGPGGW